MPKAAVVKRRTKAAAVKAKKAPPAAKKTKSTLGRLTLRPLTPYLWESKAPGYEERMTELDIIDQALDEEWDRK